MMETFWAWVAAWRQQLTGPTQPASQKRAEQATQRANGRAVGHFLYHTLNGIFRINFQEQAAFLLATLKWLGLGGAAGVLAGTASAIFLLSLQWATQIRLAYPILLFFLPIVGFLLGWVYHAYAGLAARGNNLIIEEIHANRQPIPLRMAPMVLLGTVVTHLFGGSAGREGTAIQMGSSLADWLSRTLRLSPEDRRLLLMAGISGGFGSVFGTPLAGFVFGLEVQTVGRVRYEGILPCLVASIIGDRVARWWGASHSHYPAMATSELNLWLLGKVLLAGALFGLTSLLFIELTHGIKHLAGQLVAWPPLRPFIGGLLIITLTLLVGSRDYLGLSLPLIQNSLNGIGVDKAAFLLKLVLTAVTLGTGFLGGEVTPLFVIGATMGYSLGPWLGVDPIWLAQIGFVSVFAGASNTPLACALMGIELFGGGAPLYLALSCFTAYLASGHRSIYTTQMIGALKVGQTHAQPEETVAWATAQNPGLLPSLPMFNKALGQRPLRSVMAVDPVMVTPHKPLTELVDMVLRRGVRALPVVENGRVVGMVTDENLWRGGVALRLGLLAGLSESARTAVLLPCAEKRAGDIMSQPAITLPQTASLAEAMAIMIAHSLKRVPVVADDGRLVGLITRSDILREWAASAKSNAQQEAWTAVEEVMATLPASLTVAPPTSLRAVLALLRQSEQRRVWVLNEVGQVVGIISDGDVLAHLQQHHPSHWLEMFTGVTAVDEAITAADIMSRPVITVPETLVVASAIPLLLAKRLKRVPVVNEQGQVVGLLGRADLLRGLIKT